MRGNTEEKMTVPTADIEITTADTGRTFAQRIAAVRADARADYDNAPDPGSGGLDAWFHDIATPHMPDSYQDLFEAMLHDEKILYTDLAKVPGEESTGMYVTLLDAIRHCVFRKLVMAAVAEWHRLTPLPPPAEEAAETPAEQEATAG